jgi:predicted PurR-regulated permease PerM
MDLGRGGKTVVMLAALVVLFAGVKLAQPLLVPLLLAAFLTTITMPLVMWLHARGLGTILSVVLAILVDCAVIFGIGAVIGESASGFYERVPVYQERLGERLAQTTAWLATYGVRPEHVTEIVSPGALMAFTTDVFKSVAALLSNLLLVLLIVVFMLFEAVGLREKLARIVAKPETLDRLSRGAREVNKYLAVKTGTSVLTGIAIGVWAALFRVDFPLLWGLLAFLLAYVPTIGSVIASVPAVALALVQHGLGVALAVALGCLGINFVIGNFLEPRVFGRTLGLSPLVVFVSMVFWGWLLGPAGALLAVPLTMIVKIAMANTEDFAWIALLLGPAGEVREEARRQSLVPPPPAAERVEPGE